MWKVIVLGGNVLPIFLDSQQNTVKIGISSHLSEQIFTKNGIFGSYYLVQVGSYYLVQVGCVLKNANLNQIITSNFFARNFFSKKMCWNPYFYSVSYDNRRCGQPRQFQQLHKLTQANPPSSSLGEAWAYTNLVLFAKAIAAFAPTASARHLAEHPPGYSCARFPIKGAIKMGGSLRVKIVDFAKQN